MQAIGRIVQVQVQPSTLKIGHGSQQYYDPSPLCVVTHLHVTAHGAVGITEVGEEILDVHHEDHPASRNNDGLNDISLGFTSHYDAMREKFGPHLVNGCAGENILVQTERLYTLAELENGLAICVGATGQVLPVKRIAVAAPCVPFSNFAANDPLPLAGERLKTTLQFLHNGIRGFYLDLMEGSQEVIIQAGDAVVLLDAHQRTGHETEYERYI